MVKGKIFILVWLFSSCLNAQDAYKKATELFKAASYLEAIPYFDEAIHEDASNFDALDKRFSCYLYTKNYDAAFDFCMGLAKLDSPAYLFYGGLIGWIQFDMDTACCYEQIDLLASEAIRIYNIEKEANKDNPLFMYMQQSLFRYDLGYYHSKALANYGMGRDSTAILHINHILEEAEKPSVKKAIYYYGDMLYLSFLCNYRLGNYKEALNSMERLHKNHCYTYEEKKGCECIYKKAHCLYEVGGRKNLEKALKTLRQFIKQNKKLASTPFLELKDIIEKTIGANYAQRISEGR